MGVLPQRLGEPCSAVLSQPGPCQTISQVGCSMMMIAAMAGGHDRMAHLSLELVMYTEEHLAWGSTVKVGA